MNGWMRKNGTAFNTSVQEKNKFHVIKISQHKNNLSQNLDSIQLTYMHDDTIECGAHALCSSLKSALNYISIHNKFRKANGIKDKRTRSLHLIRLIHKLEIEFQTKKWSKLLFCNYEKKTAQKLYMRTCKQTPPREPLNCVTIPNWF